MKKLIKRLFFILIIVALVFATGVVIKTGKFEKLEGYMYSFAAEITDSATSSDATSSNATSSDATSSNATSSNATSSNATSSDATSSNATSCNATSSDATSSDATSSNANTTETIKVTNPSTTIDVETEQIQEEPEVETKPETDLQYNNSEITQDVLEQISNSSETQNIIINIDNNANISEDIFTAIKGKAKTLTINVGENQIIFNGNDIVTPKEINAEITYNLVSEDTVLNEITQEGIVINFANNGELPGIALVRIKVTNEMESELDMDSIIVYHYDEEEKELTKLDNKATYKEDGFIEFSISHNSKYLFVNNIIEEKEYEVPATENTEIKNEVSFLESHKMYIMIIGVSVLAIIVVGVILIVDKKAKKK